jgi:hypothetical protein
MKGPLTVAGICVAASFLLVSALAQSQDITEDPQRLRLADLAKCGLQVGEIEHVDKVQLADGNTLTPSRRDTRLVLIQLKGRAAELGRLSLNPQLFGVNFIWRDSLKLSVAKGLCFRGKTPEGQPVEQWNYRPEDTLNYVTQSVGDTFNFWIAVEIPKDVQEVFVRFPAALASPAHIPAANGA